jgi:hypothetical protein
MKSGINSIVTIAAVGVILAVVGFLFYWAKSMGGNQQKAKIYSLQFSMQLVYDKTTLRRKTPSRYVVDSNEISAVVRNDQRRGMEFLPRFVNCDEIFLSANSVPVPSADLLFAVRMDDNSIYGIDGSRHFRLVNSNEFRTWAHVPLLNAANR